jgi:hypothetical protein
LDPKPSTYKARGSSLDHQHTTPNHFSFFVH